MLAEIITFAGIVYAGVLTEGAAGSGLGGYTDHSDAPLGSRARSAPPLPQRLGFLLPTFSSDAWTQTHYLPVVLGTRMDGPKEEAVPTEAGGGDGSEKPGTVILTALVESGKEQNTSCLSPIPPK